MPDLISLALSHDTVWAIYEPAGMQLWQTLQATDPAAHLAAFQSQPPTDAQDYFASVHDYFAAIHGATRDDSRPYLMDGAVAVLSLSGPLTKGGSSFSRGGSTVYAGRMLDLAARDKGVSGIVLLIDSPGGSVSGTQALAERVKAAAAVKPVIACVEDLCASAAYWAACGATKILANPTAMVGSIGTYMAIPDMSRAAQNQGVTVHVLSTGKHKGAGVPGAPITDAQLAAFQKTVDDLNSHFLAAVAAGRGLDTDAVAALADGRVHIAQTALDSGLIDGIGAYDDALALVTQTLKEKNMPKMLDRARAFFKGEALADETKDALAAMDEAAQADLAAAQADLAAKELELAARSEALAAKDVEIARLAAAQAEADALAAQAQADAAADAQTRETAAHEAAVAALVQSYQLTPAAREHALTLRAADAAAFDGLMATIPANLALAGRKPVKVGAKLPAGTVDAADVAAGLQGAGNPAEALTALADAAVKESGGKLQFHLAFNQACKDHPELAAAHAAATATR